MGKQTYIFKDLPKSIINDPAVAKKFTDSIQADIYYEIGVALEAEWNLEPTYKRDLTLTVEIPEVHQENVRCLLHNLHSGKLI